MPSELELWIDLADQLDALVPLVAQPALVSPGGEPLESLVPLLSLANAQLLRAWECHSVGDELEAVEDMLMVDRLGQLLTAGSQSLIMTMIGIKVQSTALEELGELLARTRDPGAHALAAERLPLQASPDDAFRLALLRECHVNEALLQQPFQNQGLPYGVRDLGSLERWQYVRDATVAQHRRSCRALDRWAGLRPSERGPDPCPIPEGLPELVTYNGTGIQLLKALHLSAAPRLLDRALDVHLQRAGLQLVTAARRDGLARVGQLPESAERLVPVYLPAVPVDPFTGKALEIQSGQIQSSQLVRQDLRRHPRPLPRSVYRIRHSAETAAQRAAREVHLVGGCELVLLQHSDTLPIHTTGLIYAAEATRPTRRAAAWTGCTRWWHSSTVVTMCRCRQAP